MCVNLLHFLLQAHEEPLNSHERLWVWVRWQPSLNLNWPKLLRCKYYYYAKSDKVRQFLRACFILHSCVLCMCHVLKVISCNANNFFYYVCIQAICVVNQFIFYYKETVIFPMVLTFWTSEKPWADHDKVWSPAFGVQEPPPQLESCGTPLGMRETPRSLRLHPPPSQEPPHHSASPSLYKDCHSSV